MIPATMIPGAVPRPSRLPWLATAFVLFLVLLFIHDRRSTDPDRALATHAELRQQFDALSSRLSAIPTEDVSTVGKSGMKFVSGRFRAPYHGVASTDGLYTAIESAGWEFIGGQIELGSRYKRGWFCRQELSAFIEIERMDPVEMTYFIEIKSTNKTDRREYCGSR